MFELWDGDGFDFDNRHEFIHDDVRHFDDFLFEEIKLRGKRGQYGFEV